MPENHPSRIAFEWGLAAVLASGVLIVAAPLCIQLVYTFELNSFRGVSREDRRMLTWAFVAWTGVSAAIGALSLGVGARSIAVGVQQQQPIGLGLLGVLLGLLALGLWLGAGIASYNTLSL